MDRRASILGIEEQRAAQRDIDRPPLVPILRHIRLRASRPSANLAPARKPTNPSPVQSR